MINTHQEERISNDGEDWKGLRYGFLRFKFSLKIVQLLYKCCCSVVFRHEIAFNHLVGAYWILITYIWGPFREFIPILKQIYCDRVLWTLGASNGLHCSHGHLWYKKHITRIFQQWLVVTMTLLLYRNFIES